jgi:hypothetical protein
MTCITSERLDARAGQHPAPREICMNNVQEANNEGQGHPPQKQYTIIVNGREKVVTGKELSFAEVVALAGLPGGPNTIFTITYRRGEGNKPEGTLVEGDIARVKDGMIFNVTATNKS